MKVDALAISKELLKDPDSFQESKEEEINIKGITIMAKPTHFKEGIPDNIKELYFDSFNSDKVTVLNFLGETVYIVSNRVDFDTVREFFGQDIQEIKIELRSKEREIESLKEKISRSEKDADFRKSQLDDERRRFKEELERDGYKIADLKSEVDRYKSWHESLQKKLEKIESLWFYRLYKFFTEPFF